MLTLEQAIVELEDTLSGSYKNPFSGTKFRDDLEENQEYIRTQAELLFKVKKNKDRVRKIVEDIEDVVIGGPNNRRNNYNRLLNYDKEGKDFTIIESRINDVIKYCNIIKTRLEEQKPQKEGGITIDDLNKKYHGKYLLFNGDEDGTKILKVSNIHKSLKSNKLEVDGYVIDLCNENHEDGTGLLTYNVENYFFGNFWYFDDFEDPGELDEALSNPPVDRDEYESHIISMRDVALEVLTSCAWAFYEHDPEMQEILEEVADNFENEE